MTFEGNENIDQREQADKGQETLNTLNSMAQKDRADVGTKMAEDPQVGSMVKEAKLNVGAGSSMKEGTISFGASHKMEQGTVNVGPNAMKNNTEQTADTSYDSKVKDIMEGYAQAMGLKDLDPQMKANLQQTADLLKNGTFQQQQMAKATLDMYHENLSQMQEQATQQSESVNNSGTEGFSDWDEPMEVPVAQQTDKVDPTKPQMATQEQPKPFNKGNEQITESIAKISEAKTGPYGMGTPEWKETQASIKNIMEQSNIIPPNDLALYNKATVSNTESGSVIKLEKIGGGGTIELSIFKGPGSYSLKKDGVELTSGKS